MRKHKGLFIIFILLLPFFSLIFKAYYQQIGAFGCFDDCFNFVAARFMLKGKTLYSQIFFNHQPLMAYLSYLIQAISRPETAYKLVLYHRIFILLFSFLMDILLILRFRFIGAGFVLFYETTKFYFFGDRFLAEAIIVQPFAYLLGLAWYKLQKRSLSLFDFLLSGVLTWFIIFMREPYIPVALLIYVLILWNKKFFKEKALPLFIFLLLSFAILLVLPFSDYVFEVVRTNLKSNIQFGSLTQFLKMFFYPLYILFTGQWNYLRQILVGLDIIFLTLVFVFLVKLKKQKEILLLFLILGFSAVRFVSPGTMFYQAFHMLPWYGLFIMSIFLLLSKVYTSKESRKLVHFLIFLLIGVFSFIMLPSKSFIWEKTDKDKVFNTNYAYYFVYGEAIKALASPKDTLFVDLWDDFVYWQADLDPSYKYSLYTPLMQNFPQYKDARFLMFDNNPPDFYYAHCDKGKLLFPQAVLPKSRVGDYKQLSLNGIEACLYIKKTKLSQINGNQWEKAKKLGFYLN